MKEVTGKYVGEIAKLILGSSGSNYIEWRKEVEEIHGLEDLVAKQLDDYHTDPEHAARKLNNELRLETEGRIRTGDASFVYFGRLAGASELRLKWWTMGFNKPAWRDFRKMNN